MEALLDGKVALITGAGNGIGAAAAELFAEHRATALVVDIDEVAANAVVDRITAAGGRAEMHLTDVRNADEVLRLRDTVLAAHGRLDVLVNNVGHWVRLPASFVDSDPAQWQALYDVNFLHVLLVTHAFLPSMLDRASGTIVNVSSVEGLRGYPPDPVYAAFKSAVVGFTRSLAVQVGAKGVKVNGIAPDLTQTKQSDFLRFDPPELADRWPTFLPAGRMGEPLDQARVLLFLASELSDFLAGHTIPTDGGTKAGGGWFPSSRRKGRSWTNRPYDP